MSVAEQRAAASQRRDEIIIEGIKEGLTVREIAARAGVEPDYARILVKKHNLKVESGKAPELTHGLSPRTHILRARLRLLLAALHEQKGMHPIEVAYRTGVPETMQRKNQSKPYPHDWKLSEIERLAEAHGLDVIDLLHDLLKPRMNGEPL